jgi:hypothetical protein
VAGSGSAPLALVHNRPVVTLDGGVRAVVDTAASALLLSQSLADSLDLAVIETVEEQGEVFTVLEPPGLSVGAGAYELDVDGLPCFGFEDTRVLGLAASGLSMVLPASLLARHAVVLDGVGGQAWFGDAGQLPTSGGVLVRDAVVDRSTWRVSLAVSVLGDTVSLLLDTGVSCSLISSSVAQPWIASSTSSAACVGPGNMAGLAVEARTPMVRVPSMVVGGEFSVPAVAFVFRSPADVAPYDGSLGGNVLRSFALGLDLSRGEVRLEQRAPAGVPDADQVGVTLLLDDADSWVVGSALTGLSPSVQVGDVLESVDGRPVGGLPLGEVLGLLSGVPGTDVRHLVLRRDGSPVEADAPVVRVL